MKLHISCKEAVDHINKKEEGKLSIWQKIQLWNHLAICVLCKRFSIQNKMLTKLFKQTDDFATHQFTNEEKKKIIDTLVTTED
ncbi:MAG: hypothetical protein K2X37_09575 [Chitinophagaceae bacterium]|jgi:hypothetical protein|nr:hypothetical protein [Chitinophagaceae bacterium]